MLWAENGACITSPGAETRFLPIILWKTEKTNDNNAFETQRHLTDLLNKVLPFSIKSDGCIDYLLFSDQGKKYM